MLCLATLHLQIKSFKPQICLKTPSWSFKQAPKVPKIVQDGLKIGPRKGHIRPMRAQLGPAKLNLKPTLLQCRFFKPSSP